MIKQNKKKFREWLVLEKQLSPRAASDIISRCTRLERTILESLDLSVSSPELYLIALKDIKKYAANTVNDTKSQNTLTGTLRAAIRKYCEYMNPTTFEKYPTAYNLKKD